MKTKVLFNVALWFKVCFTQIRVDPVYTFTTFDFFVNMSTAYPFEKHYKIIILV